MKKFVVYSSLFCLLILLIAIIIDFSVSYYLRNSNERRFVVWTEIAEEKINADCIIMGSSRAWVQYVPHIIDSILSVNTYNLGINAHNFDTQKMRYDFYKTNNSKPKLIVQNIDFSSTISVHSRYAREQFFPYLWNPKFRKVVDAKYFTFQEYYLPLMRYNNIEVFKNILAGFLIKDAYYQFNKGYVEHDWRYDATELKKLDSLYFTPNHELKDLFIDYVSNLHNEHIQIVFVYAPYYIEAINKVANLDEVYATFDSIAKAYDVPILDYTYSYLSYDTAYFYNASHLNKRGAELFSIQLAHDLDSLGIVK